jgi:hypothetical protein
MLTYLIENWKHFFTGHIKRAYKPNRQKNRNLYRICARVGKMFRILRGVGKRWPEAGRLVGWGDGNREEWERGVIGMTT